MKTLKESILSKQVDITPDIRDTFPDWIHPVLLDELLRPVDRFLEEKSTRTKRFQGDLIKVAEWFHSMKGTTLQTIFGKPGITHNVGFFYYDADYMKDGREVHLVLTTRPSWADALEREVQSSKWNYGPYLYVEANVDEVEIHFIISK